jgi:hypothetical protein
MNPTTLIATTEARNAHDLGMQAVRRPENRESMLAIIGSVKAAKGTDEAKCEFVAKMIQLGRWIANEINAGRSGRDIAAAVSSIVANA